MYVSGGQTWDVRIDGNTVASYEPGSVASSYCGYSASFTATAETQTLAFAGTNLNGGDNTVFIDDVRFSSAAPLAPAMLTSAPGNMEVFLSWSPVANAMGYRIVRSTEGIPDFIFTVNAPQTSSEDSGLSNGIYYTYTVSAFDETGVGPSSAPVSSTPVAPPLADHELRALAVEMSPDGGGGVDLRFTVKQSVPGHDYLLQSNHDLSAGSLQTVPGIDPQSGNGSDLVFFVPSQPILERQFYRIAEIAGWHSALA